MSIIPRGKGLGYAQYLPKEQFLYSTEQVSLQVLFFFSSQLSTSSYEPIWQGWPGYWDLISLQFPVQKFWCAHMRRKTSLVIKLLVSILTSEWKFSLAWLLFWLNSFTFATEWAKWLLCWYFLVRNFRELAYNSQQSYDSHKQSCHFDFASVESHRSWPG